MKSIKSAITIIALVATAFSYRQAGAESITVGMESVHKDSVKHLFQPFMPGGLAISRMTEGLPETQAVTGLDIDAPLHARLSFLDSPAEPIFIVGQDNDGQDIAFAVADSTTQPQQLQLTEGFSKLVGDEALQTELTVPLAGQVPEFKLKLVLSRERDFVRHRSLELRLGEANIGGQRYAIALVRSPGFGTYTLPPDSLNFIPYQYMIDRDGDGVFLTSLYGQTEVLEDEAFWINEPFLIDGQVYKLTHISATGDQLVIERSDQTVALAVGFEMPNVSVTRLDSSTIELTALRGKPSSTGGKPSAAPASRRFPNSTNWSRSTQTATSSSSLSPTMKERSCRRFWRSIRSLMTSFWRMTRPCTFSAKLTLVM